jgi:hypothetical protein
MNFKTFLITIVACSVLGCQKEPGVTPNRLPDETYTPRLIATDFTSGHTWDNPYVFQGDGLTYIYQGMSDEGLEHIEMRKLDESIEINGILCGILQEEVWQDDRLIERTQEFCAENNQNEVWLLGVHVDNFNKEGALINHHGSWKYGESGAMPGIKMLHPPTKGVTYREEYFFKVAENQAEVLATDLIAESAMGSYDQCVLIREWSVLEPNLEEYNYYAPGVGLIKEVNPTSGHEMILVEIR